MTTTLTSRGGYVGWLKLPRQRWRKAVESDTADDALALLLKHAEGAPGPHRDLTVLPAGLDPNHRKPTRGRR